MLKIIVFFFLFIAFGSWVFSVCAFIASMCTNNPDYFYLTVDVLIVAFVAAIIWGLLGCFLEVDYNDAWRD